MQSPGAPAPLGGRLDLPPARGWKFGVSSPPLPALHAGAPAAGGVDCCGFSPGGAILRGRRRGEAGVVALGVWGRSLLGRGLALGRRRPADRL